MNERESAGADAEPESETSNGPTVQSSLRAALAADKGREGGTWRFLQLKPKAKAPDVMDEMDVGENIARYALLTIEALKTGELPTGNHYAADAVGRNLKSFADRQAERLSPRAMKYVLELGEHAKSAAAARRSMLIEEKASATRDVEGQTRAAAGIYVYTLPHYLRHPMQPSNDAHSADRTLLKVGMSDVNAPRRVRQQSVTGLPEPPILLRIYTCAKPLAEVEQTMHRVLGAFDHNPNRQRGAGKEWFLTSLQALDELASVLGLTVEFANHEDDL